MFVIIAAIPSTFPARGHGGRWLCSRVMSTWHPDPGAELNNPEGVHMPLYETVLIARSDVTQQQVETIVDTLTAQMDAEIGAEPGSPESVVKKREYWGLRSLAYRIKKNRKGHYMLLGLDAKPAAMNEMERQLGLNEDVLRFMTIRVDAIDAEAPSAILARKSDDRERGFRGPKPAGRFESGRKRGYDDREEFRARDESPVREDFGGFNAGAEE